MFKIDGDLEVTIADAYVTEAKFPAKAGEINNRNEYVQVFYDVVVLLKDAEGNTDTWHGEISNRTGTGTYAHMYRLDLTLKTLQDIGFNVRSLQELEQQFVANEKREIVIPNMVGIGCRATVEKSEKLNKYGQPYFNVRYLNALSSGPKRLSFDTLMSAVSAVPTAPAAPAYIAPAPAAPVPAPVPATAPAAPAYAAPAPVPAAPMPPPAPVPAPAPVAAPVAPPAPAPTAPAAAPLPPQSCPY